MAISVVGIDEYMRELERIRREVSPEGLRASMDLAAGMAHRYAAGVVHVDTGRLKNSLYWDVSRNAQSVIGRVATNVEYAPFEHQRGGTHAFFDRTVEEEGANIQRLFTQRILGSNR